MGTIYAIFPGKAELYGALLEERGQELLRLARDVAAPRHRAAGRAARAHRDLHRLLRRTIRLSSACTCARARRGRSGPRSARRRRSATGRSIHALQADIFRRGVAAGEFVDEDPGYLAKMFSAMDQVLLADWVAGGMKADRDTLVRRLRDMVERALCLPAIAKKRTAAR